MNKKIVLYIFICLTTLSGFYLVYQQNKTNQVDKQIQENVLVDEENKNSILDEMEIAETLPPHPISIPALSKQEFTGRDLELGRVLDDNFFYTRYYITYLSGDLKISGIMNVPKGTGPWPVLILNHGYIDPDIYTNGRGLKREQDYLARNGFIVIHPDYRNHAESDRDDASHLSLRFGYTEDVINAIYAVKESNYEWFDKDNIGMLGHSMGGGITLNIITARPDLVKAAVLFAPVSGDYRDNFARWTRNRPTEASDIIATYGEPETSPDFWNNISPLNFVSDISAPVMIHHGDADDSVPLEWSDKLVATLQINNKEHEYFIYPGEPHEFINAWPQVMQRSTNFFKQYLTNN